MPEKEETFVKKEDEIKTTSAQISVVEDNCIIATIGGWRRRVYFELSADDKKKILENKDDYIGRTIEVKYTGDLDKPNSVKMLPLKKI